jgi:tetratricopeptide (TPR) repeat protein
VLRNAVYQDDYYLYGFVARKIFIILTILLLCRASRSQVPATDSLFRHNELIYFSELESSSFRDFFNGNPDYLAMIASINPDTDERELELYRDWLGETILQIKNKKFDKLDGENKIDRIVKHVDRSLLISYKQDSDFDDLFNRGEYNYFTAAAVYSFILERLNIPCEISETSSQIYLVAWPEGEKIRLDPSGQGNQFFMFDHETRTSFVEFLYNQGYIDRITYKNTNTRDLFQQYYFTDNGLRLRELIGMLYLNSSVILTMVNQMSDAYAQLEKAFILYPSYKTQFMLLAQLNTHLLERDYRNPLYLGYLIKAIRLTGYGIEKEYIGSYLQDIVDRILVMEEDREGFEYIYEYLVKYMPEGDLKTAFTFSYLYETGRIEFNNTRYAKALDCLEEAHTLHPEHSPTQDILTRALAGYSLMVGAGQVLEKIERYDTSYSAITENSIYLMVKLQTYLTLFGEAFQLQDAATGEMYMQRFEKLMVAYPDAGVDHMLIGRSYSSAAIYYFRRGKTGKSKQVIEKGLEFAPDNIELKLKLDSFN